VFTIRSLTCCVTVSNTFKSLGMCDSELSMAYPSRWTLWEVQVTGWNFPFCYLIHVSKVRWFLWDDLGVTLLEKFLKLKKSMLVSVVIWEGFETMHWEEREIWHYPTYIDAYIGIYVTVFTLDIGSLQVQDCSPSWWNLYCPFEWAVKLGCIEMARHRLCTGLEAWCHFEN